MAREAISRFDDHVRLSVRLTPNGGRDAIDGFEASADGSVHLKVRVRAIPEDGRANAALTLLIAKALHVPKSAVSLMSGETQRKKVLRIEGDPQDLCKRLEELTGPA